MIGNYLGKCLHCSSILEENVARVYEHLSKLTGDRAVRCLLSYIARDSYKHAECFRSMAQLLFPEMEPRSEDCTEVWGKSWSIVIENAEKILKKGEIDLGEFKSLVEDLDEIESFAAEEYLTIIHARLIESIMGGEEKHLSYFETILKWIIEDEERHRKILQAIKDLIERI